MLSTNPRFPSPQTGLFTFPGASHQPFSNGTSQNFMPMQNATPLMHPGQLQHDIHSQPSFFPATTVISMAGAAAAATPSASLGSGPIATPNNIQELYVLLSGQINQLGNQMSTIESLLSNRVTVAENKLKLHDEEIALKNEQIAHLSNTIINMQKELNSIDYDKRSKNLIIAGLSEETLTVENTAVDTDIDKVNLVLSTIGLVDVQLVDDSCLSRIGKPTNNGRPRMLQVVCENNEVRERIVKSAPKLKEKGDLLSKIYINRDTHPVYQKENARLRKRLSEIKRSEKDKGVECDAKIVKGKLVWNNNIVDTNLFFH